MLSYVKLSIAVLLCCLITTGSCEKCTQRNIEVFEKRSGREIKGQPEWLVTVTNNCTCTQTGIVLRCRYFSTTENVDTSLLVPTRDGMCLLKGGQPVKPYETVKFSYAWWPPTVFYPIRSNVNQGCSCQKCTLENLNVFEERSGREIKGQPQWLVTVTNNCNCTRTGIVLGCKDFRTTENVDTSLLVPTRDGRCLLKGGQPVKPAEEVKFSYAWWPPTVFYPRDFNVNLGWLPCHSVRQGVLFL
ncbi:hypothetical protein RHSIM_Rhsim04G0091300 [Rhododendron simsii]|uniref:Uncharacterized protein n=1 Tax=Rhododendron simsii TaxID=118357 RepID=A0A834LRC1_RHOSS|nr:hypothetical protein RHSIM_Rhsim04G0091300 [Rhododendron simsii]